jgi:hypothetical protein
MDIEEARVLHSDNGGVHQTVIYSWESVRLLNLRPRGHYRGTLVQLLIVNVARCAPICPGSHIPA